MVKPRFRLLLMTGMIWLFISLVIATLSPLLGLVISSVLTPMFGGGWMRIFAAMDRGEEPTVSLLFSGFQHNTGQLAGLGTLYLLSTLILLVIMSGMLAAGLSAEQIASIEQGDPSSIDPGMLVDSAGLALLVTLAASVPIIMAFWFSPALSAIYGMPAVRAVKMSFLGCSRNMVPFLIYGVAGLVPIVIVALAVGLFGSLPDLQLMLLLFFLIAVAPVLFASMYTACRDIYSSSGEKEEK